MRALLTGAATGIGAHTAEKLKLAGFEVVAMDIAEPAGVDQWIPVDMSNAASIDKAVATLSGHFDCLINNAGLPPRDGMAEKVLKVNYLGLVRLTQSVLPMLNENASIVSTASKAGAAWRENIEQVKALMSLSSNDDVLSFIQSQNIDATRAYNLSKEAVIVWSMAQTQELIAKGLRSNTVSPAAVSTAILDDFKNAFGDRVDKTIERIGRAGEAHEVADAIVFLASPCSHWIKGHDLIIDGGITALAQSDALGLHA